VIFSVPRVEELARTSADAIPADNPFLLLVDHRDLARAVARWGVALGTRRPHTLAAQLLRASVELAEVIIGHSDAAPADGDRRFRDAGWDDPLHRRLMQSYLVCRETAHGLLDRAELGPLNTERARFGLMLVTEALAPTNFPLTNPEVMRRTRETKGASLVRGARNCLNDLWRNGGMPAQVDSRPFAIGKNVAATAGSVVHRTEAFELIQYAPTTAQIVGTPLLVVASQVNKYYFADLAPGRSLVEFTTHQGVMTFAISWRNPDHRHADWGLETYLAAVKEASEIVMNIARSDALHLAGICAGGIMVAMLLAHLQAVGTNPAASATLLVTQLDQRVESLLRIFAGEAAVAAAKRHSAKRGIVEAGEMARFFAWLRPNELVWAHYVNGWLLGEDPPAHDLLSWNVDSTRLPARLHADYLDLFLENPLVRPNALEVLGTPLDLAKVTTDTFVVGGTSDHVTPWHGCYQSARLLGDDSEFVLSASGHVGAVVAPPGNRRSRHLAGPVTGNDPDAWLASASEHEGSWWPHWARWLCERSAESRRRPRRLGARSHPPLYPAPGEYVL
jgi:polyhydroxyalkanoate synthase